MLFRSQAEDGIRDKLVTGIQTCALPISLEVREGDWEREREKLSVSGRKGERNEREKKKN